MEHNFGATFLGKYEILRKIGQGGMGVVYVAYDKVKHEKVAVKVLTNMDERQRRLFKREGLAMSRLKHPRIVSLHEADEDGVPYLVCEYVEGSNLRDLLESKDPIPPRRAVEIVAQVLEGLDYSHREGIVHRDIKPENILLTTTGEVKVTDFGLAQIHRDSIAAGVGYSTPGIISGTPAYMSPEQANGEMCTTVSDLFSAALMLFEMLSGYAPFRAPSQPEVLERKLRELPAGVEALRADIPESLAKVVTRGLARIPEHRWPTAKAFRDALLGVFEESAATPAAAVSRAPGAPPPVPLSRTTKTASSDASSASRGASNADLERPRRPIPPLVREVVIMVAALSGLYAWGRGTAPATTTATTATGFAGTWRTTFPYLDKPVTIQLKLQPDGSYQSEANDPYPYKTETGRITFAGDHFDLRASSGRSDSGTFEVDAQTLRFKNPAYDIVYSRVRP